MAEAQVPATTSKTVSGDKNDEQAQVLAYMKYFGMKAVGILGVGGYGQVYKIHLASDDCSNLRYYAVKVIKKQEDTLQNICTEYSILRKASEDRQPFIINMINYSECALYSLFTLELMHCDLWQLLQKYIFSENSVRFYAEEIIMALDYLHSIGVMYKDLKGENVLINFDGHIKLADFGCSEIKDSSTRLIGSRLYMAPEVILKQNHGKEVDWWSLGVLIHLLHFANYPFLNNEHQSLIEVIQQDKLDLTNCKASVEFIDLVKQLLALEPAKRIGWNGAESIRNHAFFRNTCWYSVLRGFKIPPIIPSRRSELI